MLVCDICGEKNQLIVSRNNPEPSSFDIIEFSIKIIPTAHSPPYHIVIINNRITQLLLNSIPIAFNQKVNPCPSITWHRSLHTKPDTVHQITQSHYCSYSIRRLSLSLDSILQAHPHMKYPNYHVDVVVVFVHPKYAQSAQSAQTAHAYTLQSPSATLELWISIDSFAAPPRQPSSGLISLCLMRLIFHPDVRSRETPVRPLAVVVANPMRIIPNQRKSIILQHQHSCLSAPSYRGGFSFRHWTHTHAHAHVTVSVLSSLVRSVRRLQRQTNGSSSWADPVSTQNNAPMHIFRTSERCVLDKLNLDVSTFFARTRSSKTVLRGNGWNPIDTNGQYVGPVFDFGV